MKIKITYNGFFVRNIPTKYLIKFEPRNELNNPNKYFYDNYNLLFKFFKHKV